MNSNLKLKLYKLEEEKMNPEKLTDVIEEEFLNILNEVTDTSPVMNSQSAENNET